MAEPRTGRCLCGAVTFTVTDEINALTACHCGMCQRWGGGVHVGFDTSPAGVTFEGVDNITAYQSSDWAERAFCKTCGSHLYYRLTMEGPHKGVYAMGVGTLDARDGLPLAKEIFVDSKPDGYAFAGDHVRMTEKEFMKSIGAGE
ncbi:GFA family protein [Algicella marina]|uniref:GFA family protein n=1 Tax=Algicella marina TaxID=2683284 RepID=A0A6P1T7I1_9RHOB|nr:GFA family protein [Algicella marina]QHQ36532.1 GFA family protein [Algicella marina]